MRGELPAADRALFESNYLADAHRRARVAFAGDLRDTLGRELRADAPQAATPQTRVSSRRRAWLPFPFTLRPAFAFSLAAVLLALVALVVWFAVERGRRGAVAPEEARQAPAPTAPQTSAQPTPFEQAGGAPKGQNLNAAAPADDTAAHIPALESPARLPARVDEHDTPPRRTPTAAVSTLLLSAVSRDTGDSARSNRLALPAGTKLVRPWSKGRLRLRAGRRLKSPADTSSSCAAPARAEAEDLGEYYFSVTGPKP